MTDPVIAQAIQIRDRLKDVSKEIGMRQDGNKELNDMDAETCTDAAHMLQKHGTEVTRLREVIGHYRYGMIERAALFRVMESWNDDGSNKSGGG